MTIFITEIDREWVPKGAGTLEHIELLQPGDYITDINPNTGEFWPRTRQGLVIHVRDPHDYDNLIYVFVMLLNGHLREFTLPKKHHVRRLRDVVVDSTTLGSKNEELKTNKKTFV